MHIGKAKQSRGFSLVELMVVIAILAILAMMAAPSFGSMIAQKRTQQGAMDIIYAFNQARSQAALSGKSMTLTLNDHNHVYQVTDSTNNMITNFSLNPQLTIASNTPSSFTVDASGKGSSGTLYFRVCDSRVSGIEGYSVWIYPSGLSRYVKGKSDVDDIVKTDC